MIHTLQALLSNLVGGLSAHLGQWDGWAALIAAGLFGFRGGSLWMPLVVAIIINPMLYGIAAGLVHGRLPSLNTVALFTLVQILLAYAGFAIGRLAARLR
jgi:hypothetical protein